MLADENIQHASEIVAVVEDHLAKVKTDVKLPILYLIDCIVKNVGGPYTALFSQNIVATFCSVFRVADERTRAEMFKLRQTWNEVFSAKKLYAIDIQIKMLDPAWPVTAQLPVSSSIHLNPKFLKNTNAATAPSGTDKPSEPPTAAVPDQATLDMQQQLIQKQKELLELQQKKIELELLQTRVKLREQIKNSGDVKTNPTPPHLGQVNPLLKPEVAQQLLGTNKSSEKKSIINSSISEKNITASLPSSLLNQKSQPNTASKVAPVNSMLVAAAANKPIRDPRLLRQQQKQQKPKDSDTKSDTREDKSREKTDIAQNTKNLLEQTAIQQKRFEKIKLDRIPKISNKSDEEKSPKKSRFDKSPVKSSSSRHKKKDDRKIRSTNKEDDVSFKDVKSSKSRNYIRRNRSPSFSPEPSSDVDLRITGPPEKQSRLAASPEKTMVLPKAPSPSVSNKDIDLRQFPAVISKKRGSTDGPDSLPKKSKTEIFDELFGNEDTDLRQTLAPERPPTPPPPIISLISNEDKDKSPQSDKSNLDMVRAKLAANLASNKDRASQKLRTKSSENLDTPTKIVISKAESDIIEGGAMTTTQQKKLMSKIIAQFENQKLREAQKKDEEEFVDDVPMHTISDEEVDEEDDEIREINIKDSRKEWKEVKDSGEYKEKPSRFSQDRDLRVPPSNWRGGGPRGGRRPWMHHGNQRGGMRPWIHQSMNQWQMGYPSRGSADAIPQHLAEKDDRRSPDMGDITVEPASQDDIKTINIDGLPRDIRYYDETAVVFMNFDDPREISFQNGTRRVVFNDTDIYMLNFNAPYLDLKIGDTLHKVKLGAPSREIFIDGVPYECYFGGPGISISLNGVTTTVKLDGPPPQVRIGGPKTNLVGGKINLIVDAKTIVPIFLDSKVQTFTINGLKNSLQFIEGLKVALINEEERFEVQFGGLPKPVNLKDGRHYIRFTVLPKGIKPGRVKIAGLETPSTDMDNISSTNSPLSKIPEDVIDVTEPALPITQPKALNKLSADVTSPENSNSTSFFQNFLQQQNLNNLDFLASVISTTQEPTTGDEGYKVETETTSQDVKSDSKPKSDNPIPFNINDLFQKLVATGIVTTLTENKPALSKPEPPIIEKPTPAQAPPKPTTFSLRKQPQLEFVTFEKPETLKHRQKVLYQMLYTGMQCSSCGMRFPPEQSMYYSQHLDWHFRQNRRGKKNARVASSRKWYYSIADWKNYEEIEDLEEREKNYFDQQQAQAAEGDKNETGKKEEDIEVPNVTADPELQDICEMCGDKFDIFFNEEKEEWQFKNAVTQDKLIFHPLCYEEYQQQLQNESMEVTKIDLVDDTIKSDTIPGLAIVLDDDEEETNKTEEEINRTEDEVLIDESDESNKLVTEDISEKIEADESSQENEPKIDDYVDEDDDVIIKEEKIEKIILDDDDDIEEEGMICRKPAVSRPPEIDDGFVDVGEGLLILQNGASIKIKQEPIDPDEIHHEDLETPDTSLTADLNNTSIEEPKNSVTDEESVGSGLIASMDGNLEHESGAAAVPSSVSTGKIKINISKPLPVISSLNRDNNKDNISENDKLPEIPVIDPSQPLPPGEEPVLLTRKPSLQGVNLKQLPPVQKGSELTGLCSIM